MEVQKDGEDSFHKMVVVLLGWLGIERALVQGSDDGHIKQYQVGSHRVRMG